MTSIHDSQDTKPSRPSGLKVVSVLVDPPGSVPDGAVLLEARAYLIFSIVRWLWESLFSFSGQVFQGELGNLQAVCEAARSHPACAEARIGRVLELMIDLVSHARCGYEELGIDQKLRVRMVFCAEFIRLVEELLARVVDASGGTPRCKEAEKWVTESRGWIARMPRDLLRQARDDIKMDLDPGNKLCEFWLGRGAPYPKDDTRDRK